jgi:hypothetical protein
MISPHAANGERSLPMMRPLGLVVAALLCLGCQTPTALVDPFIGQQRVPPPSTGLATAAPPDNSYYNPPKSGAAASTSGSPYVPPSGSYSYDRGATTQPVERGQTPATQPASIRDSGRSGSIPIRSTNPSEQPPQGVNPSARRGGTSNSFQVNNNPPVRIGEPARTVSTRGTTGSTSALARAPSSARTSSGATNVPLSPRTGNGAVQRPTDIMNLPEARPSARPRPNTSSDGFRPVGGVSRASYEVEQEGASGAQPTVRARTSSGVPAARYNYDRAYRTLSGKLEYSRADDRWKLRYIPIDGETDDYGGSVVLAGAGQLDDFQPGEFVTVSGSIEQSNGDGRSFAPSFRVDRMERQADR